VIGRHEFLVADAPAYPVVLPLSQEHEVVRTTVRMLERGPTVSEDVYLFTHYVRRA